MKKIYQQPSLEVLEIKTDGILCQASGGVDGNSSSDEGTEDMVKSNRYSSTSVDWDDWQ